MEEVINNEFGSKPLVYAKGNSACPWRRFFARHLDMYLYTVVWGSFLSFAMNVNWLNRSPGGELIDILVCLVIMLFVEPLLLHIFGTTLGKWVVGIHITNHNGKHLSYHQAFIRTRTMFVRGMGFFIPIYDLVRLWKSYQACKNGDVLEWEEESEFVLHNKKVLYVIGFIGVWAALFGTTVLVGIYCQLPKHRGEITVEQFSQNYNRISDYLQYNEEDKLDEQGKKKEQDDVAAILNFTLDRPEYQYREENGVMKGMSFSQTVKDSDLCVSGYQKEMLLCIISFVEAQKGYHPFSNEVSDILNYIQDHPFEEFQFTACGVNMTYKVKYSGYTTMDGEGYLIQDEGKSREYSVSFEMNKQAF